MLLVALFSSVGFTAQLHGDGLAETIFQVPTNLFSDFASALASAECAVAAPIASARIITSGFAIVIGCVLFVISQFRNTRFIYADWKGAASAFLRCMVSGCGWKRVVWLRFIGKERGQGCPRSAKRFLESFLSLLRMHWDHEPAKIGPRLWSKTQPQRVRSFGCAVAGASHTAALRFIESENHSPVLWHSSVCLRSRASPPQGPTTHF